MENAITKPRIEKDPEIKKILKNTESIQMIVDNMRVISKESQIEATTLIKQIKDLKKEINDRKEFFTKPFNEVLKYVREQTKAMINPLDDMEYNLRKMLNEYQDKLEEERRKEQEKFKKKAEESIKKGKPLPVEKPIEAEKKVKGEDSTLSYETIWKFEILVPEKIPAEYMIPDSVKIGKVVRAGVREIPGVRIYPERITKIR